MGMVLRARHMKFCVSQSDSVRLRYQMPSQAVRMLFFSLKLIHDVGQSGGFIRRVERHD